jgi:hypothetical protein
LLGAAIRRRGTLLDATLGSRHPARDVGKRLGGADGTLLRVVNLFTVQAKTSRSQLHYFVTACVVEADGHPAPANVDKRTSGFRPRRSIA